MSLQHIFISYIHEDASDVERLSDDLKRQGVDVWLDREKISPGERWQIAIRRAIENGAFYIACFSENYSRRETSYMNVELAIAVEQLALRPTDRTWFIPLLLTGGTVPDKPIGGGETLRDIQWVDLTENWVAGLERILAVLSPDAPLRQPSRIKHSSQTILFSDLVGITALGIHMQEDEIMDSLSKLVTIQQEAVLCYNGRVASMVGDGMLAMFDKGTEAIQCAVDILQDLDEIFLSVDYLRLRIGIAEGPVLEQADGNNFTVVGSTPNLAARISSMAEPGQILVTEAVAISTPGVSFDKLGPVLLKGVREPVQLRSIVQNL